MSQQVLSEQSGLDRTYIGKIERRERVPSLETIVKIAAALDIEPFQLLRPEESTSSRSLEGDRARIDSFHHQVKNHFQLLRSLVQKQKHVSDHETVTEQLEKISQYISTFSRLYGRVLSSVDNDAVDMSVLLQDILRGYRDSLIDDQWDIDIEASLDSGVELNTDDAITCALVTNELVLNAINHAFGDNYKGKGLISVSFAVDSSTGQYSLEVTDNGRGGVPEISREDSLSGLGMVKTLVVHDLRGEWSVVESDGTTRFHIQFERDPVENPKPERVL